MNKNTSEKIIEYISKNGQASGHELAGHLGITDRAVRKQLKKMLEENKLFKAGKPPKVFYGIADKKNKTETVFAGGFTIKKKIRKYIDDNYLIVTPDGERKEGWEGFVFWCEKTRQDLRKMAKDYAAIMEKYNLFRKTGGLVDGMPKMKKTFSAVYLDKLFYIDFYSIERFGKTKLGQLLLYAKQSQDRKLIEELSKSAIKKIKYIVKKFHIDGIGYVPPTVKREVQFMKELQKNARLPIKTISISKIKTDISVAQKTLNKLDDRVENAKKTFVVEDTAVYKNILLVDDAVGSGATLNEIAKKIKEKNICKGKIIGLAITGSFKGFDVISEV